MPREKLEIRVVALTAYGIPVELLPAIPGDIEQILLNTVIPAKARKALVKVGNKGRLPVYVIEFADSKSATIPNNTRVVDKPALDSMSCIVPDYMKMVKVIILKQYSNMPVQSIKGQYNLLVVSTDELSGKVEAEIESSCQVTDRAGYRWGVRKEAWFDENATDMSLLRLQPQTALYAYFSTGQSNVCQEVEVRSTDFRNVSSVEVDPTRHPTKSREDYKSFLRKPLRQTIEELVRVKYLS